MQKKVVVGKLTVKVSFAGKIDYKNTTSRGNWFHLFFYSRKDIVCNGYHDYHEGNNDI